MDRIFSRIVELKKTIVIIFISAAVLSAVASIAVDVNYDFSDYLPETTPSTTALEVMSEEYQSGTPNARLAVPDTTVSEALALKEKLLKIDGVTEVTWLDDTADIYAPMETIDKEIRESYYKNNTALFSIVIDKNKILECVQQVKKTAGEDAAVEGTAVNTAVATETTGSEVGTIMLIVVPICFLILLLTTTSWFEPVLFMVTIGIAIIINNGTNIFFGEISFVSKSASSILQLAVSMDYSIFLLHRFSGYRKTGLDVQTAMKKAMKKSFFTITASGLTTVIGFAALLLMEFEIGPDLGMVMTKAIAISMICVLVLLPVLALISYRWIDKTQHRPWTPDFKRFGQFVSKIKAPAAILFAIIIIPAILAQSSNSFWYGSGEIFGEGTEAYEDQTVIEEDFGKANRMVLLVPKGDFAKENDLSKDIAGIEQVDGIVSYVDTVGAEVPTEYLPAETLNKLLSDNYSRMVITVKTEQEGETAFSIVEQIKGYAQEYYGDTYHLAGETVTAYDMRAVTTKDMTKVNIIAVIAVFLILLITMRSISIPVILVLVIETSIWINLSIPYFADQRIYYIAYLIISTVQLGATVDYAILMASRYLETRKICSKKDCIVETVRNATLPILTSASILTLGGGILAAISTNGVLTELGTLVARGAVLSAALVLLVLPGLLYMLDKVIAKTTWQGRKEALHEES